MGVQARLLLLLPFLVLLGVFFVAPLGLMVAISVSRQSFGDLQWTFTLHHYARFFSDAYYVGVLCPPWPARWPPLRWCADGSAAGTP
jgi:ABC-type sugar transport system permease subunit